MYLRHYGKARCTGCNQVWEREAMNVLHPTADRHVCDRCLFSTMQRWIQRKY